MKPRLILIFIAAIVAQAAADKYPGLLYQETDPSAADKCFPAAHCSAKAKYRSIDGSCNNQKKSNWGRTGTPLVRLAPARYSDGVDKLPISTTGRELGNPLAISAATVSRVDLTVNDYSTALPAWSQLIMYDNALFIQDQGPCCQDGKPVKSDSCASLSPPPGEEDQFQSSCVEVTRTKNTKNTKCKVKPAEQLDGSTHFLDLSSVYGTTNKISKSLRSHKEGKLKIFHKFERRDTNVNSYVDVKYLHMMFAKEHNRVADGLHSLNPSWKDERLYQEARRIVIAEYQQISLYEMLPLLTGSIWEDNEKERRRRSVRGGRVYPSTYDPRIHPGTINEVAAGCFYFYIDLVPGEEQSSNGTRPFIEESIGGNGGTESGPESAPGVGVGVGNERGPGPDGSERGPGPDGSERGPGPDGSERGPGPNAKKIAKRNILEEDHEDRELTVEKYFDRIKLGVSKSEAHIRRFDLRSAGRQKREPAIPPVELAAFHIQKARDHGLASYNEVRKAAGAGAKATTFADFEDLMCKEDAEFLSTQYESVDDVDLLAGIVLEKKEPLAVMGPTCNRITEEQFRRWKLGDRFWYEHENQAGSFTDEQLAEIDKRTLARLICDNDNVDTIPRYAFWQQCQDNPVVDCSEITGMSLDPWKE